MTMITKITDDELVDISDRLRSIDKKELALIYEGWNLLDALRYGVSKCLDARCLVIDNKPEVIYGIIPKFRDYEGDFTIWLLGTEFISQKPLLFMRLCKEELESFKSSCCSLSNYVLDENVIAIRFLRHLGFKVDKPKGLWRYFEWNNST